MTNRRRKKKHPGWWWLPLAAILVLMAAAGLRLWGSKRSLPRLPSLALPQRVGPTDLDSLLQGLDARGFSVRRQAGSDSLTYSIIVPPGFPLVRANLELQRLAGRAGFNPVSAVEDKKRQRLELLFLAGDTLGLNIRLARRRDAPPPSLLPKMALALYPWPPAKPELASRLDKLPQIKTLIVRSHIKGGGREAFCLLPMEPKGYPKVDPGPGTILVDDPASRIREKLGKAAGLAQPAAGLCVWHGSRAVEDWRVAELAASYCGRQDLVLLELFPHPQSLIKKAAQAAGCGYLAPDLVIASDASSRQAEDLLRKALARGRQKTLILVPTTPAAIKALEKVMAKFPLDKAEWVPASGLLQ